MTKTRMASEIQGLCSKGQFQSLASLQQVSSKDTEGSDFLLSLLHSYGSTVNIGNRMHSRIR